MKTTYDAVVIGSGFGGAVAACRLAQVGFDVGILERGRRYTENHPFPRDWSHPKNGWLWQHRQGLFDVKPIKEMLVVQGAGFGGGSLIYANVHLRAPADVFASGWPAGYTREALDPYYDLVAYMLDIRPITDAPSGLPPKTRLLAAAAEKLQRTQQLFFPNLAVDFSEPGEVHTNKFNVRQAGCTSCGECDIGCNVRAKNTLDFNYLALAEQRGADVGTQCEVVKIAPAPDGYFVYYRNHVAGGVEESVHAKAVFLCAGAVSSTELLLRCRDDYETLPGVGPTLGEGYSGNGDFLAFAFDTAPPYEPSNGPTITTALVYDAGQGDQRCWFTLQDGGYPKEIGSLLQLLRPEDGWLRGVADVVREELEEEIKAAAKGRIGDLAEFPKTAVFLAMGRDRSEGRLELHPLTKALRIRWDLADNLPLYDAQSRLICDVAEKLGGKAAFSPFWTRLHQPVSVHNLGGCRMADDPDRGVTDSEGQVFGYSNLFVLDGGILPSCTGVNPSHTIAAVAERNIERVIRRWKKEPDWRAPDSAAVKPVVEPMSAVHIPANGTPSPRKAPVGLLFTETMKGFFTLHSGAPMDVAGYVAAEKLGERAGAAIDFTLTITMADLDRFLVDRSHTGSATGLVNARGLTPGDGAVVTTGTFNLFTQAEAFYERKMLYALPFVGADGLPYLLDGFKEVKDHGDFDLWGATSTLYTVIRAGHTHAGPVIAAGILRIQIPDFLHQLTTFRVPGANGAPERLDAMRRFGTMFMGSLWDVFVAPKLE